MSREVGEEPRETTEYGDGENSLYCQTRGVNKGGNIRTCW